MQVGNFSLRGTVLAAPLAGVSERAYRVLALRGGAALVFTEMISADGLVRDNARTLEMLEFGVDERPIGVQLFGADPVVMGEAAAMVAERYRPEVIDVNFGCPVRKVVGRNGGAAVLKDPGLAGRIMEAVVKGTQAGSQGDARGGIPVTIKIRTGWDEVRPVYLELGRMAEGCGVAGVTLHARSRSRGYAGAADWGAIGKLKAEVGIAVIGNGDVVTPEDAARMVAETGCDGVMVGRGSLGDPEVFGRMEAYLKTGQRISEPSVEERLEWLREHVAMAVAQHGEYRGVMVSRKFLGWYTKGLPGAAGMRGRLFKVGTVEEMEGVLGEWLQGRLAG